MRQIINVTTEVIRTCTRTITIIKKEGSIITDDGSEQFYGFSMQKKVEPRKTCCNCPFHQNKSA